MNVGYAYLSEERLAEEINQSLRRLARDFGKEDMWFQRVLKQHTLQIVFRAILGNHGQEAFEAVDALFGLGM